MHRLGVSPIQVPNIPCSSSVEKSVEHLKVEAMQDGLHLHSDDNKWYSSLHLGQPCLS
jgi:hypothetical protein